MDKKQEYEYKYIHKLATTIDNGEHSTIADWLNYYAKEGYRVISITCTDVHPISYACVLERKTIYKQNKPNEQISEM